MRWAVPRWLPIRLEVTFHGRSCHIASLTDSGINALDCAVDLYQSIKMMKQDIFPKGGCRRCHIYSGWHCT